MEFEDVRRKATQQNLYEARLTAVRERVARIAATGDLSPALAPEALADAEALDDARLPGPTHPEKLALLGWLYWYRWQALGTEGAVGEAGAAGTEGAAGKAASAVDARRRAAAKFSASFLAGVDGIPEPLLPDVVDTIAVNALGLLRELMDDPEPRLVDHNARLWQRLLDIAPPDHPARAAMLSNLAIAAGMRYERTHALDDLDTAIDAGRRAVELTPPGDPQHGERLSNLLLPLGMRFEHTGAVLDLDALIDTQRVLVRVRPGHLPPGRPLERLAGSLWRRHEITGSEADLDGAIETGQRVLDGMGPGEETRSMWLYRVGVALDRRYERHGREGDQAQACDMLSEALAMLPPEHSERPLVREALEDARRAGREGRR